MGNIDISSLRKGDIIVSTGNSNISKAIRIATGSDISHALLYVGNNNVIEALGDGVTKPQLWTDQSREMTLAIGLTYRGITNEQRDSVVENAKKFIGLPYDEIGAAGAGMYKKRGGAIRAAAVSTGCVISSLTCVLTTGGFSASDVAISSNATDANKDTQFFCSELVARAYELAGIPLVVGRAASFVNPRQVRMSDKLNYLGHLVGGK